MANPMTEAAVEAVELETFATEMLPDFVAKFSVIRKTLKERGKTVPVSVQTTAGSITRPSFKQPFRVQTGTPIQQLAQETVGNIPFFTRGTGSTTDAFALSPFIFVSIGEISNLAMWAVKSNTRSKNISLPKDEVVESVKIHEQGLDAVCLGDSTGTFDTIPPTAVILNGTGTGNSTSSISGLNTAVAFVDQQVVQVFNGAALLGAFTISYVDPVTRTLYSAGVLPAGTAIGNSLILQGATGVAGQSVSGIRTWHVNSNTGVLAGINRAAYPGRLSTPTINLANSGGIGPTFAHRVEVLRSRARGEAFNQEDNGFWLVNPQMGVGLAADFYGKEITTMSDGSGSVPDTAKKFVQKTYGGRELLYAEAQLPNRMDLIEGKNWVMGELFDTRLHDFMPGSGTNMVPVPATGQGANATYYNSTMFVQETGFNLMCINPKAEFYVSGAPVPSL